MRPKGGTRRTTPAHSELQLRTRQSEAGRLRKKTKTRRPTCGTLLAVGHKDPRGLDDVGSHTLLPQS